MSRTPPAASEFVPRTTALRFRTPPGVKLVRMAEDETNPSPVLVCEPCGEPTKHGLTDRGNAKCLTCGRIRKW